MPREFSRARRLADAIQRELAQLVQRELADPRFRLVTVSHVDLSRDLSAAKVYVVLGTDALGAKEPLAALNRAAGHLRHLLAQRLALRSTPRLRFVYDVSLEDGMRLTALIDEALAHDRCARDK